MESLRSILADKSLSVDHAVLHGQSVIDRLSSMGYEVRDRKLLVLALKRSMPSFILH